MIWKHSFCLVCRLGKNTHWIIWFEPHPAPQCIIKHVDGWVTGCCLVGWNRSEDAMRRTIQSSLAWVVLIENRSLIWVDWRLVIGKACLHRFLFRNFGWGVGQRRAKSPRSVIECSVVRRFVAIANFVAKQTIRSPIASL